MGVSSAAVSFQIRELNEQTKHYYCPYITNVQSILYIKTQKYIAVNTNAKIDMVVSRGHALSEEARLVYGVGVGDELGIVVALPVKPVTFVGTDKLNF